ncbi:MAG TPA: VWA domain-containing protein [Burkholderiales bacterium]|nr:VWA domain-containing protein [Burkholderiales bacterium]
MLALRHPILRRDFARRFLDAELLQYALRAPDEKGKGPMIVCLDGSSSMAGDKEIWSKAVSLTLLDIAQRQRRLFRSICFSSADMPLQVLDLNRRQRYVAEMGKVMEMAEYFPGGGTDFQQPLSAALECLQQAHYRRGDIVFITDGECRVDAQWVKAFKRAKERLGFSVLSVLIDVGSSSLGALTDFSDKITTVSQLSSEASKDIFLKIA